MSNLKAHWLWIAAYGVAWVWLFWFTDFRVTSGQAILLLVALNCFGAAQRRLVRYDVEG